MDVSELLSDQPNRGTKRPRDDGEEELRRPRKQAGPGEPGRFREEEVAVAKEADDPPKRLLQMMNRQGEENREEEGSLERPPWPQSSMAAASLGKKEKERLGGGSGAACGNSTRERLLAVLEDLEVLSRELIEMLAISRNQKLLQAGEVNQVLELLVHRDGEFQELMKLALNQGKIHHEMQVLEKEVEKRDSDIQRLQKQLKEAEQILATAVYQAKEKLKSIDKARKGAISSEEIIKYAHRISASRAVCAPLTWVPGDPRRPYPTI
ncbi:Mediator of RNA polymerase II transcription subunit 4 [Myotis brandtii]|uniref:Mediator of RNA polymerase II transcription subunit 4 n=1 Tax=Myotis brandtii TaxID=109478 RepID=S7NG48_MYOBR|nr:Mediator of RNA polymerase II transcription subunit 4 [Myotis brandtii]